MKKKLLLIILTVSVAICTLGLTACGNNVENFNLSFVVHEQVYETIETSGNESVSIPNDPEKAGYEFDGWYWDNGTWQQPFTANSLLDAPISSDMRVYAKMNLLTYSISYELNGGSNSANNPSSYTVEDSITFAEPTKNGYDFSGWDISSIAKGTTGDKTITASWSLVTYTITYKNTLDCEHDNPTEYNINSEKIVLDELTKEGYVFLGWYIGNTKYTAINSGSYGNKTLTAKWRANTYTITYNLDGGSNSSSNPDAYTPDDKVTFSAPSKKGYEFKGWHTDSNYQNAITEIPTGSKGEMTLYAKFELVNYQIEYVLRTDKLINNNNASAYIVS